VFENIIIGATFAFAAAVQPGPLQAFLLSRVAAHGWRRTLPAAASPLLSDGPIALVVLLLLGQVPVTLLWVLQAAGGVLLLYLAGATFRAWRAGRQQDEESVISAPRTLLEAALVNILNPNPYLGWSLVLGPQALKAWSRAPSHAVALIAAFYLTMVAMLALIIVLFGTTRALGARGRRVLVLVSAVALAALGVYQVAASLHRAGAPTVPPV